MRTRIGLKPAIDRQPAPGTAQHRVTAVRLRNRLVLGAFVDNAGLSEREVARRAGLSHSTINHLMTGRRATCTMSTAVAIARVVHCPVGALFIPEKMSEQQAIQSLL